MSRQAGVSHARVEKSKFHSDQVSSNMITLSDAALECRVSLPRNSLKPQAAKTHRLDPKVEESLPPSLTLEVVSQARGNERVKLNR